MKFDFSLSGYSRLWDSVEGRNLMTIILNDPNMIRANYGWWKTKFQVDPNITPTLADGTATFKSEMRELTSGEMMEWRSPLGDSYTADKKGIAFYTGIIPDFMTRGYVEKATEREYKERLYQQFGNDASIVLQFADELQRMIDSRDQTLSNTGAQLISTGKIVYNFGLGNRGAVYKADVPKENFVKAGTATWSSPDCQLLTQMRKIEKTFRDKWGLEAPMQWEITRDMFEKVFLKNKEVTDWIINNRKLNNEVVVDNMAITESMFNQYISTFEGVSPIVLVEEKQKDGGKVISGWKQNIAVLRPAGYAGMIRHTTVLDQEIYEKYGAKSISRVFTSASDGLGVFMNTTLDNGNLREWHTDFMVSAIPSLDEFLYHIIVDTEQAGEGTIS